MKKLKRNNGITLIALVITIIVLLILAGVSISMLTSDNGIIKQAQSAKEETLNSSEKEAIALTMINREMTGSEKYNIGEELRNRTLANGDNWKIVSINETKEIYGTGWYYVGTGVNLENYGETKHEWIINYDTGEIIELPEEGYTKLAYGDNLAVKDGIILNADPINMGDENSWGDGVTIYGMEEGDGYGWNETEFKLDGVDDYIEIYPQESVKIENGLTFEFYGKSYSSMLQMLSKTIKNASQEDNYSNRFRTRMENSDFLCCMSSKNCGSDWILSDETTHWIKKKSIGSMQSQNGGYLTMTIDIENDNISLYWEGKFIASTICSHEWLIGGDLLSEDIPFTVGLQVYGNSGKRLEGYSKVDIYACRLYNKVLTADEVKDNYNATVTYHNLLVKDSGE